MKVRFHKDFGSTITTIYIQVPPNPKEHFAGNIALYQGSVYVYYPSTEAANNYLTQEFLSAVLDRLRELNTGAN